MLDLVERKNQNAADTLLERTKKPEVENGAMDKDRAKALDLEVIVKGIWKPAVGQARKRLTQGDELAAGQGQVSAGQD